MPDTSDSRYSPDVRRQALTVYASVGGRKDLALPMLAELGLEVNIRTLQDWAYRRHPDEYAQIRQEYEGFIRSQAADSYREIAALATDVASASLTQMAEALRKGEVDLKELPKFAQSAMVAAGVATDKGELLSGNPTERVSHDIGDSVRELASVGITILVPGADGKPGDARSGTGTAGRRGLGVRATGVADDRLHCAGTQVENVGRTPSTDLIGRLDDHPVALGVGVGDQLRHRLELSFSVGHACRLYQLGPGDSCSEYR
jgi:hypothetical protein